MASPFFFSLSFFLLSRAAAQPTPYSPYSNPPEFNSSMAIIIVILISVFFVMGFLSIYLRLCSEGDDGSRRWSPRQAARGLDAAAIAAFPKVVYGDVKEHKIGKDALECAICLSEFEEEDSLRLIPTCDHVFHPECIDAWLAAHATCPICRADLAAGGGAGAAPVAREQQVAEAEVDRAPRLSRSKSTGHSIVVVRVDDCDRFTLRLPEQIRREVMSGKMRRSKSFAVLTQQGEGSSRGGRSFKFWTEGRSLFSKSFSLMSPRRDEGSTKRGPDRSGHGVCRSEQSGPGLC